LAKLSRGTNSRRRRGWLNHHVAVCLSLESCIVRTAWSTPPPC